MKHFKKLNLVLLCNDALVATNMYTYLTNWTIFIIFFWKSSSLSNNLAFLCLAIFFYVLGKPRLFTADSQTPDKIGIGNNDSLIISVQLLLYPPSSKFEWDFTGNNNQSHVIENNTLGYKIASITSENEQNITLFKQNVSDKEFGSYDLTIVNSVGTFTKTYKVNGASK